MSKKELWNIALTLVRDQVGDKKTDGILSMMLQLTAKYQTLLKIYERFCISAQNRWRYPQVIGWIEEQPDMQAALNHFDIELNRGWSQERFYHVLTTNTKRGRTANLSSSRNLWKQFAGSLADITGFLAPYADSSGSAKRFRQFVTDRALTKECAWELAAEVSNSIRGMGATLVCDTLKEIGFTQYSKPDLHIKRLFTQLGYSRSDDDRDVFYALWDFSTEVGVCPSQADKIFWLIGSGNYYMFKERHPPQMNNLLESAARPR